MNHADRERRLQEAEAAFRAIMRQDKIEQNTKTETLRAARLKHEKDLETLTLSPTPSNTRRTKA